MDGSKKNMARIIYNAAQVNIARIKGNVARNPRQEDTLLTNMLLHWP